MSQDGSHQVLRSGNNLIFLDHDSGLTSWLYWLFCVPYTYLGLKTVTSVRILALQALFNKVSKQQTSLSITNSANHRSMRLDQL